MVFLKRGQHFVPYILETNPDDPEIFIHLAQRATECYNWDTMKWFECPCDVVDVIYAGKGGFSYFFREGKFTKLPIGD